MTWSERATAAALLLLLPLAGGCRPAPERGFLLGARVHAHKYSISSSPDRVPEGLSFPKAPETVDIESDHERRPVVLTEAAPWRWRGRIPKEGGRVYAGVEILPAAWKAVRRLEARVVLRDGDRTEVLDVARTDAAAQRWLDLEADLSRYADREVTLEFSATLDGLPEKYRDANLVGWGPVSVSPPPAASASPHPNVLVILVDTLRADHLTPYGYRRDTSPEIKRWIADRGAVFEEAYSQAPWTLPSVVSLLTGRYPGELLGPDPTSYGIPDGVESMAERMARLGYQTGGFIANPTLHAGAGFDGGFRTFYAPPADIEWIRKHADSLNAHAVPWLRAHQERPFFAYVHYVDPHDPYENPDMPGGRSPYMPDYKGPVEGTWVHGIYSGKLKLEHPEQDIPYIVSLYDTEIHYADRYIGQLLAALDPKVLANTIVILTADHGEELHDHGGWKHGQTLYDEQIHVPLIVRWDGHVTPGTRLSGTVQLVDVLPTILAAAGGTLDADLDGVDLLPALTGAQPLQRRPAFAQHLSAGPLRAASILDRHKLILFNRDEPWKPSDPLQAWLWEVDRARLQPLELYDLTGDPKETRNLGDSDPTTLGTLAPVIHRQLDAELPGLWLLADGAPAGSRLGGTIVFQQAPKRWVPYFLGSDDHVRLEGNRLTFDLACGRIEKGLRIEGDPGRIESATLTLDGAAVPPARLLTGPGNAYAGGPVSLAALRSTQWPPSVEASVPGLARLWIHEGAVVAKRATSSETEKRLRNLGYIQ
jgi:arylsulfatase A-like enzyme